MQTTFDTIKAVMTSNVTQTDQNFINHDNGILGKKLLIKMCNTLTVKMEMGGPMVAHYLLGGKGYYTNINFKNLYWSQFFTYITDIENLYRTTRENNYSDDSSYLDTDSLCSEKKQDNSTGDIDHDNQDIEVMLDDDEEVIALSIVSEYTMRGESMNNINLMEFYTSYDIKDFSSGNIGMDIFVLLFLLTIVLVYSFERNYQERPIRFAPHFPKFGTKAIFHSPYRYILNLTGHKLPSHGTEDYFKLICILFIPWRAFRDLNAQCMPWEHVYTMSNVYQKYSIYL